MAGQLVEWFGNYECAPRPQTIKSAFSIALICIASRRIPVSASQKTGQEKASILEISHEVPLSTEEGAPYGISPEIQGHNLAIIWP